MLRKLRKAVRSGAGECDSARVRREVKRKRRTLRAMLREIRDSRLENSRRDRVYSFGPNCSHAASL